MLAQELPDTRRGERPGPGGRKRQPSMSETMPLYTLCKEDLESMDKEVRPAGAARQGQGAHRAHAPPSLAQGRFRGRIWRGLE